MEIYRILRFPYVQERHDSWDVLKRLVGGDVLPWLVCDDFNEIMYGFEKKGGLPRNERRIELFQKTLEDCHLFDVGYEGNWFTWERGNLSETNIQERLDRGVANTEWFRLFPEVEVQHLTHTFSNHCPLLLDTRKDEDRVWNSNFRFEAWWLLEESFICEVKFLWENSSGELPQRLERLKEGLKEWARRIQFNRKRSKRVLTEKLEELFAAKRDDKTLAELIDTKISLNFEIEKDEWIERCIHEEDNQRLTAPYSREEVTEVVFDMGPTKAPGKDGFPAAFYQKCWQIVGKDFRPISLCNVLYKILAKVIANRLRLVIKKCIDEAQSAFVLGRLISNNVLLAYEVLHKLKQKKLGKKGFMAVKLDMSKAYDRVEWCFIEEIMVKMGFDLNWVKAIMKCLSSVSYSVIINGFRGVNFLPTRGLRQEDPLSPFLFLLCGEGLSSPLRLAMKRGISKGIKISRNGPRVSHLLFADDCILFGEATRKGAIIFQEILEEYKSCLGQSVNFEKSSVFFSKNTLEEDRSQVVNLLRVRRSNDPERYLGLPNIVGRKKNEVFQNQKDRFKKSIDSWSISFLSAELETLPSYTWKSVWAAKGLLQKGLSWRVGRGDRISIWEDSWIQGVDKIGAQNRTDRGELKYRRVTVNDRCPRCYSAVEESVHVFRECPLTIEVWQQLNLSWVMNYANQNIWEWLTWVFKRSDNGQCLLFCYALWMLWYSRNQLVHERRNTTGRDLAHNIQRHLAEFEGLKNLKKSESINRSYKTQEGIPSTRIYFNAAFDSRTFSSATGLVGWDLRGNLMVLKTVIHRDVPSPFAAEAYACLKGAKLGSSLRIQSVRLMGDSKSVIKKCQATSTDKSVIGAIISDIQKKKADFQEVIFQFIHRSENTYAHRLAKIALEKEEDTYLMGEDLEGHAFASAETWLKEPE
ncbi:uncharacterized protein [Gossypium hirsutum]|uniref:Reverse transcriptase domain-containing protein n=1 Tax=Gossypium hirsutum TaxID=3635 RepID=A0A1U8JWA5_GOSHI|nr:uncharacterized protein LOC107911187 [Gossypium hirsutum]